MRTRPIVNVQANIDSSLDVVDPSVTTCHKDAKNQNCFELTLCFKFTAEPKDR